MSTNETPGVFDALNTPLKVAQAMRLLNNRITSAMANDRYADAQVYVDTRNELLTSPQWAKAAYFRDYITLSSGDALKRASPEALALLRDLNPDTLHGMLKDVGAPLSNLNNRGNPAFFMKAGIPSETAALMASVYDANEAARPAPYSKDAVVAGRLIEYHANNPLDIQGLEALREQLTSNYDIVMRSLVNTTLTDSDEGAKPTAMLARGASWALDRGMSSGLSPKQSAELITAGRAWARSRPADQLDSNNKYDEINGALQFFQTHAVAAEGVSGYFDSLKLARAGGLEDQGDLNITAKIAKAGADFAMAVKGYTKLDEESKGTLYRLAVSKKLPEAVMPPSDEALQRVRAIAKGILELRAISEGNVEEASASTLLGVIEDTPNAEVDIQGDLEQLAETVANSKLALQMSGVPEDLDYHQYLLHTQALIDPSEVEGFDAIAEDAVDLDFANWYAKYGGRNTNNPLLNETDYDLLQQYGQGLRTAETGPYVFKTVEDAKAEAYAKFDGLDLVDRAKHVAVLDTVVKDFDKNFESLWNKHFREVSINPFSRVAPNIKLSKFKKILRTPLVKGHLITFENALRADPLGREVLERTLKDAKARRSGSDIYVNPGKAYNRVALERTWENRGERALGPHLQDPDGYLSGVKKLFRMGAVQIGEGDVWEVGHVRPAHEAGRNVTYQGTTFDLSKGRDAETFRQAVQANLKARITESFGEPYVAQVLRVGPLIKQHAEDVASLQEFTGEHALDIAKLVREQGKTPTDPAVREAQEVLRFVQGKADRLTPYQEAVLQARRDSAAQRAQQQTARAHDAAVQRAQEAYVKAVNTLITLLRNPEKQPSPASLDHAHALVERARQQLEQATQQN